MFAPVPFYSDKGVVTFLDMYIQEMLRRHVFVTFQASIQVCLVIVRLVLLIGPERQDVFVRGHGALHGDCRLIVQYSTVEVHELRRWGRALLHFRILGIHACAVFGLS